MSTFPDPPFNQYEERYFLAEILKKSSLPSDALLNLIREAGIDPAWTEIALPNGRSLSSCQLAFNALVARSQPAPVPAPATDPAGKRLKRNFPTTDTGTPSTISTVRDIQPRPLSFSSVNGQQQMIAPAPIAISPVEPPRKKRGRPTKSEFERRQAEARERGEVWPKPRKPKTPRTSMEGVEATGAPSTAGSTSAAAGMEAPPESSQRPPSMGGPGSGPAPTAVMYASHTPGMGVPPSPSGKKQKQVVEGIMPPGGQIQHEEMRAAQGSAAPEAQHMSEFGQMSQSLLQGMAGLRQHPQMAGSPHMQQTGTGSSTPMQSPYGPTTTFPGFPVDERPPEQRQQ